MAELEHVIHELLPAEASIDELMRRLIDSHAERYPSGDWTPFYEIAYDREIPFLMCNWFPSVIENHPPMTVPVSGLWFGLFQPMRGGEAVADFYVAGSRQFELDSDSDWAVGPEYFPEGRYANSQVLADIYRSAYGSVGGLGNKALQYLCLGYVAFALKSILADVDLSLILITDDPIGVAIGWDSGSPLYVGFLASDGFKLRDAEDAIAGIQKRQEEFDKWLNEKYGDDA